jgi:hypothetical protein
MKWIKWSLIPVPNYSKGEFEFEFEWDFLVSGQNEPCAVLARPLPLNVNTAQNAAMKLIKLKVSSQTVSLYNK